MGYPFPTIASRCPLCGDSCGAIYRGYYRRWVVAPEVPFVGWVAIRTALCRRSGTRFALFPEFLIPARGFSRQGFLWLARAWRKVGAGLTAEVDGWFSGLGREVYLATSTLYSQLGFVVRELRVGGRRLGVPDFRGTSLLDLAAVPSPRVDAALVHPAFGCGASRRIDPPPDR